MSNHKMVIVMRKFKNLRNGKYIAQACHAALGAVDISSREDIRDWAKSGNTKIVVYVDSEQELCNLQEQCRENDLVSYLVVDAGRTEFDGPTITALAIGPHKSEKINNLTSGLPLF